MYNETTGTGIPSISAVTETAAQGTKAATQGRSNGNPGYDPTGREPAEGTHPAAGAGILGHLAGIGIPGALLRPHPSQPLLKGGTALAIRKPFLGADAFPAAPRRTKHLPALAKPGAAGSDPNQAHPPAAGSTAFLLPLRVKSHRNCPCPAPESLHHLPHQTASPAAHRNVPGNITKAIT